MFDQPDDNNHPDYTRIQRVGATTRSNVWVGRRRSDGDGEVVLKYIEADPSRHREIISEIENHILLDHPHIVRIIRCTYYAPHIVVEVEPVLGGTMEDLMSQHPDGLEEATFWWYFFRIALAVHYCHRMDICHRDITLKNLLLTKEPLTKEPFPTVKLHNLEWSKDILTHSTARTLAGTLAYQAPEVLSGNGGESYDGEKYDVWSLGVVAYYLAFGIHPFYTDTTTHMELIERITAHQEVQFPEGRNISPQIRALIESLLHHNPNFRTYVLDIFDDEDYRSCADEETKAHIINLLPLGKNKNNQEHLRHRVHETWRWFANVLGWHGRRRARTEMDTE